MAALLPALPTPLPLLGVPGAASAASAASAADGVASELFAAALASLVPAADADGSSADQTPDAPAHMPLRAENPSAEGIADSLTASEVLAASGMLAASGILVPQVPATVLVTAPALPGNKPQAAQLPTTSGGPVLGAGLPDQPRPAQATGAGVPVPTDAAVLVPAKVPEQCVVNLPAQSEPAARTEAGPLAELARQAELPPSSAFPVVTAQPFAPLTPSVPNPPAPTHHLVTVPMAPQLAKPIFTLAAGAPGVQVMTVKVTPENLGPVTVQAHIGAEGLRVELFAPTDAGRAAVQAVLPDLRRDLADAGLAATLDLSERNTPHEGARDGSENGSRDSGRRGRREEGVGAVLGARASPARAAPFLPVGSAAGLDILA